MRLKRSMGMTAREQKKAAALFAARWAGKGYEKGECQKSEKI